MTAFLATLRVVAAPLFLAAVGAVVVRTQREPETPLEACWNNCERSRHEAWGNCADVDLFHTQNGRMDCRDTVVRVDAVCMISCLRPLVATPESYEPEHVEKDGGPI